MHVRVTETVVCVRVRVHVTETGVCVHAHARVSLRLALRASQQSKYKVINKDQWCNVLEFSRLIRPDLSNYDEDGACKSTNHNYTTDGRGGSATRQQLCWLEKHVKLNG